jgi:anthranilate synthase/aminodeoxychorismate synthase-like glutamine amidotransferase
MNAHVLLIDNYDSFTWNLAQAFLSMGARVDVRRNDRIGPKEARELAPSHLVISPGPGRPEAAGATLTILEALLPYVPVLGVCLGHQALAVVFGGRVIRAPRLLHGKASPVYHDGRALYAGLPNPFPAGRYHSLCVDDAALPAELSISAFTSQGEVRGFNSTPRAS